jgi:hypothetical protein
MSNHETANETSRLHCDELFRQVREALPEAAIEGQPRWCVLRSGDKVLAYAKHLKRKPELNVWFGGTPDRYAALKSRLPGAEDHSGRKGGWGKYYPFSVRLVKAADVPTFAAFLSGSPLPREVSPTPVASDISEPPERIPTTVHRVVRDTDLARRVKAMHGCECQICGHTIQLPDGSRYAEAHHIQSLGHPHHGPDVMSNILCLCPNHHAAVDLGAISLRASELRHVAGHPVGACYIDYHNRVISGPKTPNRPL